MKTDTRYIAGLNALRFFAALFVLCYHLLPSAPLDPSGLTPMFDRGILGVDVFFILSGFILAHVYSERALVAGNYREFLQARIARILPLHLAIMATLIVLVLVSGFFGVGSMTAANFPFSDLPTILTLTHAWTPQGNDVWNAPSWSLSAEWFCYVFFPVFLLAAIPTRERPLFMMAVAVFVYVAAFVAAPVLAGDQMTELTADFGIYRIIPAFFLGAVLRLLMTRHTLSRDVARPLVPVIGFSFLAGLQLGLPDAWLGLLVAALILSISAARLEEGRHWLASRPLHYLGELSFAIYLIHVPVHMVYFNVGQDLLGLWQGELMPWTWFLVELIVIGLVSVMSYHFLEVPARRWVRGWGRTHRQSRLQKEPASPN